MAVSKLITALLLAVPAFGTVLRSQAGTCPSSAIYWGMEKDAASDTMFAEHDLPTPGECEAVMSEVPRDGELKLCGPGKWSISRMSCDKHEYKNVEIDHPKEDFTKTTCKVYPLKDYFKINGFIGSVVFTC
mmetsp:Transcript_17033/g.48387  ORF Transcript_17033/g.48387 Transcript_17033/m.48387 type:complete len:131 (+) Transcript_17033:70-462(+)